ncbi:MAG: GDP-mannose dehydrogenase [Alphaproteobacteria bacterium]|nr:GDP-mannose dehydrogenase [Alphaproteobacteria bacterium]
MSHSRKVSVTGLGYVGLPVAVAFARHGAVVGYDHDPQRVAQLRAGEDRTGEIELAELRQQSLHFTDRAADLRIGDFHIVTVPTPIDGANVPDLQPLLSAASTLGKSGLKRGDIVVFESTVYPGLTEEECVPAMEKESGLVCGSDFAVGYSPERINPGDRTHRLDSVRKVIAAGDTRTLDIVEQVYGSVVKAGLHRAASIKVAEAAKVLENTQRDLNIALINEMALICHRLGIDTRDVLETAGTKWNFLPFRPGLVGGHCIGVDPFYLTHKAMQIGYHPQVILAGRRVNDGMGRFVATETIKRLMARGLSGRPVVTILGATFKENVPDVRNTRCVDIVRELEGAGIQVQVHDPLAAAGEMRAHYGIALVERAKLKPADAVILAVAHQEFVNEGWALVQSCLRDKRGLAVDVQAILPRQQTPQGVELWRL